MLEITLCRHARMKHQCQDCQQEPSGMNWRACADCEHYAPLNKMTRKNDGRIICAACQQDIEAKAIKTAQSNLFVTQPDLF